MGHGNSEPSGRFFINLGEMDGMDQDSFRAYAAEVSGLNPFDFKRINIKGSFSFFDVDPKQALAVYDSFQFKKFNGRKIRIDHSDSKGGSGSSGGGGQYGGKSDGGFGGRSRERSSGGGGGSKESWGFKGKSSGDYGGGGSRGGNRSSSAEPEKKREFKRRRN
jgi:ATP-dependent RNA helicase DeaD